MAAMAFGLTVCLLVIGLVQSLENVAENKQKLSTSGQGKVIFFKAFLARGTAYGVSSTIVFSNVQHNIGGAYNPFSGIFTAPVTGLYEFKSRVERTSGADAKIALFNQRRPGASTKSLNNWESYGISTIMKVKNGDHVYVEVTWTDDNNHITLRPGYYTQFTGYLLREL